MARLLKPEGYIWAIVYGNGEEIEWFMRAHETKHIAGEGRGFLIVGDGFTYLNKQKLEEGILSTGVLYVIEDGTETANGAEEISKLRIANMLKRIASAYINCGLHASTVADLPPLCLKT